MRRYPVPTDDMPDDEDISEMMMDGECWATDGCTVEPDGVCPDGHPSWLIALGIM